MNVDDLIADGNVKFLAVVLVSRVVKLKLKPAERRPCREEPSVKPECNERAPYALDLVALEELPLEIEHRVLPNLV